MVFYPFMPFDCQSSFVCPVPVTNNPPSDNEKRAIRLQQLVDSMDDVQTDVKKIGRQIDEKNAKYRPAINILLKANGMDSVDDVVNKAASLLTPKEREEFEAVSSSPLEQGYGRLIYGDLSQLIKTIKDFKSVSLHSQLSLGFILKFLGSRASTRRILSPVCFCPQKVPLPALRTVRSHSC